MTAGELIRKGAVGMSAEGTGIPSQWRPSEAFEQEGVDKDNFE